VWWDFPADTVVAAISEAADGISSFMFGPKFLAAPVTIDGARQRTVYLPETPGGWTHYYSRATFPGGANVTVPAPFDELPLFERTVPPAMRS
jgi:alpha-D-xyloside xylohydrolase